MKKYIYGLIDSRSSNFGDICLLDRDEEFRDGVISVLSNSVIPEYIVDDLVGVCYGSVTYDSDMLYPKFDIAPIPSIVVTGLHVASHRKEDDSRETVSENS